MYGRYCALAYRMLHQNKQSNNKKANNKKANNKKTNNTKTKTNNKQHDLELVKASYGTFVT